MKKILFALIPALLISGCAKLVVVHVPYEGESKDKTADGKEKTKADGKEKIKAEGVFYALPQTVVHVNLKVDRNEFRTAPYQNLAKIFWPDDDVVCEPSEEDTSKSCADKDKKFSIQKGATFSTFGEPDPKNVYMVKFAGMGAIDQSMTLAWTETGVISSATATVTNRTGDVIVSGLKLAAGIGAKAGFGASLMLKSEKETVSGCPESSTNDAWILKKFLKEYPALKQGARERLIGNFCEIPKVERADKKADGTDRKYKKYGESPANALLLDGAVAAYIAHVVTLVEARDKLLSGTSSSFAPVELIAKIDSLLTQQVKGLYLGSKGTKTWEAGLDIRDIEKAGEFAILRLEPKKGVCLGSAAKIAPDSKPLPDGFGANLEDADCKKAPAVSLNVELYPAKQLFMSVDKYTAEPSGERSFRYRIPGQVKAEITDSSKATYGVSVFSMAQLGTVRSLPAERHSKSLTYTLGMVEATGGLKNFTLGTTGVVDAGTVDALSSVSGTLLDARNTSNAADKAAALADKTAKDELTVLTRQGQILKLKDDICTLQKKYGLDCTIQP